MLKAQDAIGYKMVVDARNGKVLARTNLVHNLTEGNAGIAADESYTFSGDLPATDGACHYVMARSRSAPATARWTASRPPPCR